MIFNVLICEILELTEVHFLFSIIIWMDVFMNYKCIRIRNFFPTNISDISKTTLNHI